MMEHELDRRSVKSYWWRSGLWVLLIYFTQEAYFFCEKRFYKLSIYIQVATYLENTKYCVAFFFFGTKSPIHLKLNSFIFADSAKSEPNSDIDDTKFVLLLKWLFFFPDLWNMEIIVFFCLGKITFVDDNLMRVCSCLVLAYGILPRCVRFPFLAFYHISHFHTILIQEGW